MPAQPFVRDVPDDPVVFLAADPLLRARAGDVRFEVVDDFFAAAAVRFEADFLAGELLLELDFLAGELLELDFLAGELLELDFLAGELLELDFLAGELLELDFFAVEPFDADFFAVEPFEDFPAEEPPDADFFEDDPLDPDLRRRFTLPSWISPPQPSTSSWLSRAWLATWRRKCLSSRRTRRP
jgi:hypothetical protein